MTDIAASAPVARKIGRPKGAVKWLPDKLAALRKAYEGDLPVREVAAVFSTDMGSIQRFARQLGWKRRFTPQAIAHMTAARARSR